MAAPKPAIVIIPGAFHVPSHYGILHHALVEAGYEVTVCDMPSTGPPEPTKDLLQDIAVIQKAVQAYIDRGMNVVLTMHSIGGIPGSCACRGFRPEDQPSGKGIISLVFICSFALQSGVSAVSSLGQHAPWVRLLGGMNTGDFMTADDPKGNFYNDCSPQVADEAAAKLQLYSENCCHYGVTYEAWKEIESNYLMGEIDQAVPVQAYEAMSKQEGGKWKYVEHIHAGHSPFLSKPKETAAFVRKCAGEDVS